MNALTEIFCPTLYMQGNALRNQDCKFAYYTTASTALKIIKNKEIWLRNALIMNDYSEISYGLNLLDMALKSQGGRNFEAALNSLRPNLFASTMKQFDEWKINILADTFIVCLSAHDSLEDVNGRLSMWRAYGNIALVIHNTPFLDETIDIGIYSLLVNYWTETECEDELSKVADQINQNRSLLNDEGEVFIQQGIYTLFLHFAIGTKHPGFIEERELRIFAVPAHFGVSKRISRDIVEIGGVPQEVMKLPLIDDPENGLKKLDIPNLLHKLVIGPTQYPFSVQTAFFKLLNESGVGSVHEKVSLSNIPIRSIS